jgi:hypothetical protein
VACARSGGTLSAELHRPEAQLTEMQALKLKNYIKHTM